MSPSAIRLSRLLQWIFFVGMVLVPVLHILMFWNLDWVLQRQSQILLLPGLTGIVPTYGPSPISAKLSGFAVALVPMLLTCALLRHLSRLFAGYARGEIFTADSVRRIRRVGGLLLVREGLGPFVGAALSIVLSLPNPPGQRVVSVGLSSASLTLIVAGLTLLVAAHVMDQGRLLHEDARLVI